MAVCGPSLAAAAKNDVLGAAQLGLLLAVLVRIEIGS
jgi:hypothetical protein